MSNPVSANLGESLISEMTTEAFVVLLQQKHVEIEARDGRLKISAPAGAIDAPLRAELKKRKSALLEVLIATDTRSNTNSMTEQVSREEADRRFPLTPAQQGIWLIEHFNPGDVSYNISEAFQLEATVDPDHVQAAADQLVVRHSILRASFHEDDGELFQSIAVSAEAPVRLTDLSALTEDESERTCRDLVRREGLVAFDLEQAPLVRFHLFRLANKRHVLSSHIHHIIADRMSLYMLREELVGLVRVIANGRAALLPEAVPQFVDFAVRLSREEGNAGFREQISYWQRKLTDLPVAIELAHTRPRPQNRSSNGAARLVVVPPAVHTSVKKIGTGESASSFMTYMAIFAVCLARWSQAGKICMVDFCIGSPITHRKDAATQRMIGLFVNMLPFRCTIAPGMSFRDVLKQVRSTALEAYENSDVPFQKIVSVINPARQAQRSPIFQVMFGYETYLPPVANEFPIDADAGTARYDLSLNLTETERDGLTGAIEYCTDLFNEGDIERFAEVSEIVLVEILRNPENDVFGFEVATGSPGDPSKSPGDADAEGTTSEFVSTNHGKGGLVRRLSRLFSGTR